MVLLTGFYFHIYTSIISVGCMQDRRILPQKGKGSLIEWKKRSSNMEEAARELVQRQHKRTFIKLLKGRKKSLQGRSAGPMAVQQAGAGSSGCRQGIHSSILPVKAKQRKFSTKRRRLNGANSERVL